MMEDLFSENKAVEVTADSAGVAAAKKKEKKPINQQKLQDNIWGWAFCAPLIIGTLVFVFVAFLISFILSFCNYTSNSGATLWEYFGRLSLKKNELGEISPFYNYIRLFITSDVVTSAGTAVTADNDNMWRLLFNTVFYMIGIPVGMILSMVLAVLMSRDIKGSGLFRVIYYIPCITSTVAVTFTFQNLFKSTGVINSLLGQSTPWLDGYALKFGENGDPYWCGGLLMKVVVIIMSVWKGLGGTVILFCAGLSGVNAATKEAASIDGANSWMIFWKVTMPDLAPTIFYTIVTSVIGGMQIYAEPQLLFGSTGVNEFVDGYVAKITYYGFFNTSNKNYSYGCALGMFLFVIILILTLIQFKLQKED